MKKGSIKIILGCMFSGKTTALIREFREWSSINKQPLCINYSGDNRYGNVCENNMYNHNLLSVQCIYVSQLKDVDTSLIEKSDIILVNEGQFFPDLVDYCLLWCEKLGKNIVVSGLDGDFQRKPFGKILDLIPLAESVKKLNAFCANCANGIRASFTHRKSQEKEQVVIGTHNYEALCRTCFIEKNKI